MDLGFGITEESWQTAQTFSIYFFPLGTLETTFFFYTSMKFFNLLMRKDISVI